MPVAIDTSVLIAAEKVGDLAAALSGIEESLYVPAHAAAEFLACDGDYDRLAGRIILIKA